MSIVIQQVTFRHPDNELLFHQISFSINKGDKTALTGNNGTGKSTLLQIIGKKIKPSSGTVICSSSPYYVPQHFGQYDQLTIAEVLGVSAKLSALQSITEGDVSEENFALLDDDWEVEEKALAALAYWGLSDFSLHQALETLSGGEKTKVFLSGMQLYKPEVILMDEPTNHLDSASRAKLYDFIRQSSATMLIVSHDRVLLNQLNYIYELHKNGINAYGGNYDFYKTEKEKLVGKLQSKLESREKELRMARKAARELVERRQKQSVRGEKASIKKGVPRIAMGTFKDQAEKSSSRLKNVHEERQGVIRENISELKEKLPDISRMKVDFDSSSLHKGKVLIAAEGVNFSYGDTLLWEQPVNFEIRSGERLSVNGGNGSGKSTLLKLIIGELAPSVGRITRSDGLKYVYIDQEYSILDNGSTVYGQACSFNSRQLPEHELKLRLSRFLFSADTWNKSCQSLSGGEKMRLAFCCLMISDSAPDLFILDEPTNNIDLRNIEIITSTVKDYEGTVIVVSHDAVFKEEIGVEKEIEPG